MCTKMKSVLRGFVADTFFTYTSVKIVQIPNTVVALIYRILEFVIVAYIALYIVWIKKGYQEFQEPRGTSVIKVKGVAKVSVNGTAQYTREAMNYLWDTAEYQIPPLENNAFFIATRQTVTFNQTESSCSSALNNNVICTNETASTVCPKDQPSPTTFGFFTGNCIPSRENDNINVCEIRAWCPEELSKSTEYTVDADDMKSFTVFLKTLVTFTGFNITMRNVRDDTNFSCRYDKDKDPRCPIFRIGYILDQLNTNKQALLLEGGLIEIRQKWDCNFDYSKDKCYPQHDFNILQAGDDALSPGINYRSAERYQKDGVTYRTLSKIYGLRFVVSVTGTAGRFYIVNLFVAIGSGIGFMAIAGIVCDIIFMYIHKYRERYREGKFTLVEVGEKRLNSEDDEKSVKNEFIHRKVATIQDGISNDGFL